MPAKSGLSYGNLSIDTMLYLPSVTYPTLGANASGSNTFPVPGVQPLDMFSWNMQNPPAHLVLDNICCLAPGVITILWSTDATGISTGSVAVLLDLSRVDGANLGTQVIPSALV